MPEGLHFEAAATKVSVRLACPELVSSERPQTVPLGGFVLKAVIVTLSPVWMAAMRCP